MVLNLVLNLILMGPFLHVGIAMATAISSWINAGLMAYVLSRRGHLVLDARLKSRLARTIVAVAGLAAALLAGLTVLEAPLQGSEFTRIMALIALVGGGLMVFAVLAAIFGAARPADLKSLLARKEPAP